MDEKTERHPEVGIMASGCLLKGIICALKNALAFWKNVLVFPSKRTGV
jgi:hypothetical protein